MTKNMTDMKYTTSSVDAKTIKSLNTIQVKWQFSAIVTDCLRKYYRLVVTVQTIVKTDEI